VIKTKKGIVNGEGSKYRDADSEDERHRGIIVEADRLCFGRDQLKGKTGIRTPDITAIFFNDAWVPK
jgi:hypothetical protein